MRLKLISICLLTISFLTQFQVTGQDKPNILIIMTDQLSADAMSYVSGNKYLATPNIDAIAKKGLFFTRAYSPNPLCVPARTSIMTGTFPHQNGIIDNDYDAQISAEDHVFMGKLFKDAGYETAYFGKWHVAFDESQKEIHGFDIVAEGETRLNSEMGVNFLLEKHEKPFFAIASFLSPHEICQWSRRQELPGGSIGNVPPVNELPPIKENFTPPQNETDIMTYLRKSYQQHPLFPVSDYTEYDWQRLRWGYYRLVERADRLLGEIISALHKSGKGDNTIVVFMSDHGECYGSHQWVQKTVFYDESVRVPLIISWNNIKPGTSDELVNIGTDLIPTLSVLAGISIPRKVSGIPIPILQDSYAHRNKRKFIVSENHFIQNVAIDGVLLQPHGRMVRSNNYKYCLYSMGERRESLFDMNNDPGEMINLAENPSFRVVLDNHRKYLVEHAQNTNDSIALSMVEAITDN